MENEAILCDPRSGAKSKKIRKKSNFHNPPSDDSASASVMASEPENAIIEVIHAGNARMESVVKSSSNNITRDLRPQIVVLQEASAQHTDSFTSIRMEINETKDAVNQILKTVEDAMRTVLSESTKKKEEVTKNLNAKEEGILADLQKVREEKVAQGISTNRGRGTFRGRYRGYPRSSYSYHAPT